MFSSQYFKSEVTDNYGTVKEKTDSVFVTAYNSPWHLQGAFKGIVQQILRGVETRLNRFMLVTGGQPVFFNFKGTPSQEGHQTIFSSLKINEMALSDQTDFPTFFLLRKMTYPNLINSGI
jgi:hypothetical protein